MARKPSKGAIGAKGDPDVPSLAHFFILDEDPDVSSDEIQNTPIKPKSELSMVPIIPAFPGRRRSPKR